MPRPGARGLTTQLAMSDPSTGDEGWDENLIRWGMEFAPIDDGRTEAEMWVEVDLRNIMRALPSGALKGRIQRVMDIEMVAIKAAVESTP